MTANEESKKTAQPPSSPNAKRRRNEAAKTQNSRTRLERQRSTQQADNAATPTVRSQTTKTRQLLIQPKIIQKGKNVYFDGRLKRF